MVCLSAHFRSSVYFGDVALAAVLLDLSGVNGSALSDRIEQAN
jgi:hypothetical protein